MLILVALFLLLISYSAAVIIKARVNTLEITGKALSSNVVKLRVENLSAWQINALLKVEDPSFYQHKGIDFRTPGAGLTTITQSLVKIFYFKKFKPGFAKLKQTLIARFALDPMLSKSDQLLLFINNIYLGNVNGHPVHGLYDASMAYYGKTFDKLNENEYLSIVAMIIAPENFSIIKRHEANAQRVERIKKVISGEYKPNSLMDIYYGWLSAETMKGLAPASYFPSLYKNK